MIQNLIQKAQQVPISQILLKKADLASLKLEVHNININTDKLEKTTKWFKQFRK